MRQRIVIGLVLLLAVYFVGHRPAIAATIEFVPSSSIMDLGDLLDVDVLISGLGAFGPPSVGAFDLSVAYDPGILSATGVTFGPYLGDPFFFEALTGSLILPGTVEFSEVSLLLPIQLDILQPGSFALATLSFVAVGLGGTALSFVPGAVPGLPGFNVSDAYGEPLPVTAEEGSAMVIPEPATFLLLGSGLALLAARRRKHGAG